MGNLRNRGVKWFPTVLWLFYQKSQQSIDSMIASCKLFSWNKGQQWTVIPFPHALLSIMEGSEEELGAWCPVQSAARNALSSSGPCCERPNTGLPPLARWITSPNSEGTVKKPPWVQTGTVLSRKFLRAVKAHIWSPPVWFLFLSFDHLQTQDGKKWSAIYYFRMPACFGRQLAGRFFSL